MKKLIGVIGAILMVFAFTGMALAAGECATIQDGVLFDSEGYLIETGYNEWGHNYQALMFNGGYCDSYRDAAWCQQYADIDLMMKWNSGWLSNKDCDGDGLLDRHYGNESYIGSGAWLTNHQSGKVEVNGKMRKWTYFVKIIAVPEDAILDGDYWYTVDGIEIGEEIWGQFAVVQQISNDPSFGEHGVLYKAPAGPGLGNL